MAEAGLWQRETGAGEIASRFPESKAGQRARGPKSCFAVHSCEAPLRWPRLPRKFPGVNACRTADFTARRAHGRFALPAWTLIPPAVQEAPSQYRPISTLPRGG